MESHTTPHHGNRKAMNRFDLTQRLVARLHRDEAVIGGIGNTNFDLWMAGQRPQNFYMLGSMGLACPIALGVALAQPARFVVAVEGDGSLLMQLSCLSTIGTLAPKNLLIIVMDNACYQITGGQPTATAGAVDLVGVARASGLRSSHWAEDEASFESLVERCLAEPGPHLLAVRTDNKPATGTTERDPVAIRQRFMRAIAAA
jgi:thiamine pyrophosphate-dependent acetolactate synthase large subunit-like protein